VRPSFLSVKELYMFRHRLGLALVGAIVVVISLFLAACGGGRGPSPAPKPTPAKPSEDIQDRVSDSFNRTMGMEEAVFDSFHLEANGTNPKWNEETEQVEDEAWSISADVSGDDVYLEHSSAIGDAEAEVTKGYVIDGGIADDGEEYEVVDGKLQSSFLISLTWVAFPLEVVIPLAIAATGPTLQGEEVIDGRTAERYTVDSAKAPAGAMEVLGEMFTLTSSKGTVWVDKETGAMLKANLAFEQKVIYPPGSATEVGRGSGTVEVEVTKVGQVTVRLPQ